MPAATDDPFAKFSDATERYQSTLTDLWKNVFKKLYSYLKPMIAFGSKLIAKTKDLVHAVGATVIKSFERAYNKITGMLRYIPELIKKALKLGAQIVATIAKAADPRKVIATLKKLFARYVAMLQEIFEAVTDFVDQLDILGKALAVVEKAKSVLQYMLSWIKEVSGAAGAVKKARDLLTKTIKTMKVEIKEATQLSREVAKLKPA